MAKKKKQLTEKELESLKSVIEKEGQLKARFFEVSIALRNTQQAQNEVWAELLNSQNEIMDLKNAFSEKYGDVNINIATGEFVEALEEN